MDLSVSDIAEITGGVVVGDGATRITGVRGIKEAQPGDLTFLADPRYAQYLDQCPAAAVLVTPEVTQSAKILIQVKDPRLAFAAVLVKSGAYQEHPPQGVHPAAVIGANVSLGRNVGIDALVRIADNAVIGDGVVIYAGAYIGYGAQIGMNTVIHPNVCIYEGVAVGARCILHAGAVLGSDGFGFRLVDGRQEKIPQVGRVLIGDDVEIGANSAVDRAAFGETVIGDGTKIDNLVQIGHNVRIGKHCVISGNAGIAGSATIGNYVTIAAGAGVAGHLEIGDHAVVAALSGVTKSIPPGKTVSGFPAISHAEERRIKASLRSLPELLRRVHALEQRIMELEGQADAQTKNHR